MRLYYIESTCIYSDIECEYEMCTRDCPYFPKQSNQLDKPKQLSFFGDDFNNEKKRKRKRKTK